MYLYGASGHAKVIIDMLIASGVKIDALFDDDKTISELMSIPVKHQWNHESPIIISIGNNFTRKQIAEKLCCEYGIAIHPSAIISPYASIGEGSVVMQGTIVQSSAHIGKHCIVNTGATVDHECVIEDYVHISPKATLCGNVYVEEGAWIGASAVVVPGVRIGKWSLIGAGSVVVSDIPDGVIAYGNPCRVKSVHETCCSKRIAIYGAGGLGREVAGGIQRINQAGLGNWNLVGFYDDAKPKGFKVSHLGEVLGGMDELNAMEQPMALAIAVGTPMSRRMIHDRITNPMISFPNLISPSFKVLDPSTFKIGEGNIIQDNCSVTCDVEIGDYNVLNGSNVMGHDVKVGNFNVMMPGVRLSGEVSIGDNNLLGVDSVVLQRVKVGNNITLGAGSVLMTKPKDGFTYIGVPAKKFDFK
jgi:sugar O-acyltransferase (sialic acid O-acetyltransferase NeuD family)